MTVFWQLLNSQINPATWMSDIAPPLTWVVCAVMIITGTGIMCVISNSRIGQAYMTAGIGHGAAYLFLAHLMATDSGLPQIAWAPVIIAGWAMLAAGTILISIVEARKQMRFGYEVKDNLYYGARMLGGFGAVMMTQVVMTLTAVADLYETAAYGYATANTLPAWLVGLMLASGGVVLLHGVGSMLRNWGRGRFY